MFVVARTSTSPKYNPFWVGLLFNTSAPAPSAELLMTHDARYIWNDGAVLNRALLQIPLRQPVRAQQGDVFSMFCNLMDGNPQCEEQIKDEKLSDPWPCMCQSHC